MSHLLNCIDPCALPAPSCVTLLTTYQCPAACKECSFKSSPSRRGLLSEDSARRILADASRAFSTLRFVVFTGGECFLLGDQLDRLVAFATEQGLGSRCVTNGYWATSPAGARARLKSLKIAGLGELNLSTGDAHQAFVSFEKVAHAALAALALDIPTVINVESGPDSKFTMRDILRHPNYGDAMRSAIGKGLTIVSGAWVPFGDDDNLENTSEELLLPVSGGCRTLFDNLVVLPNSEIASCCGLALDRIPEMTIGRFEEGLLIDIYRTQFDDFAKIWLFVDGPEEIVRSICQGTGEHLPRGLRHPCQWCEVLFTRPSLRMALRTKYAERVPDVLFRFSLGQSAGQRMQVPKPESNAVNAIEEGVQ
jgi:hypothetical protein